MIDQIIIASLGGFFGKYRGGLFRNRDAIVGRIKPEWLRKTIYFLVQGDVINALAFALMIAVTHGTVYLGVVEGQAQYGFVAGALALFAYSFVMMMRGATPGWGDYIGAAKGTETANLAEVYYIDRIIKRFVGNPRLWGVLGLSLRCGEWGLFIGAPLLSFWPVLAGLCAGPIVLLLSKALPDKYVWGAFEIALGALFFLAAYNA